ncbi:MAG: threonine/serine exporter family protein [Actinophytocola sp.]|uniref:threonine/serine ThrE exporter family protein n=1 Tax=Actinophytocola sp. TaxID=1872138 RepID=UPI003C708CCA
MWEVGTTVWRNRSARTPEISRWEHLESPGGGVQGPALPSESTVHFVLDLALRIGEVQMSSGAGASDVTATIIAVTNAYGLPHCEVDVIFTSITVACHRGVDLPPVTSLRVVRSRSLDYTRLALVERLVRDITLGRITAREAHAELDRLTSAPHPYPRWLATAAYAGMAAAVTVLIGGDAVVAVFAAAITAVIDRIGRLLNKRALPFFFQQIVGGALATGCALAIVASNVLPDSVRPTLMVASAITVLLSGLSLVSTVQDAITGYNVTAAGRTVEVSLMTAGLIAGVVIALNIAVKMGLPSVPLADPLPPSLPRLPLQALAGGAAAACFALASYATPRAVVVAGAAGAAGAAGYGLLGFFDIGSIASSAVAATVIGFSGGVLSRRLRIPPLVIAVAGMVPLLPGLTVYRALFELAVERTYTGMSTLMVATSIALALAAGVVLGEYLAQPVRYGLGRLERRLSGPRMAGPLRPTKRRLE